MNTPEITTTSYCDDEQNETTKAYSIFDSAYSEKKRTIFNDKNEEMSFLKLPDPMFKSMKRSLSLDSTTRNGQEVKNTSTQDENVVNNQSSLIANLATRLSPELSSEDENEGCDKEGETGGKANAITAHVHKRLQEQLALKQREVQEIQQKIAKNKKWGDPRRGPSQDRSNNRHSNNRIPMVRSCPDSLDQMPIFDVNQRNNKVFQTGSNLDPNSPCFYPSMFSTDTSIWGSHSMGKKDQFVQNGDVLHPIGISATMNAGGPGKISPTFESGTDMKHSLENDNSFRHDAPNNKFGVVGGPKPSQGRSVMESTIANGGIWPKPPMREPESRPPILTSSVGLLPPKFEYSNEDNFKRPQNLINPHFNSSGQNGLEGNVLQRPMRGNFETQREEIVPTLSAPNMYSHNRMRIVRKRQDGNKTWKQRDIQPTSIESCPLCKHGYQWPHVLSCLHSFCFSCIVKYFDQEINQVKCPTCFTDTEVNSDGLQHLDLDFTLCKMLIKSSQVNPFSCMSCSQDNHASVYCQDCMKFICCGCRNTHNTNISTAKHKIQDVAKVKKDNQNRFVEVCQEHPENTLDQYCQDCKQLICAQCTSFDSRHASHSIGNVNKLYNSAVHKMRLMSNSMDEVRNEVQKRIQPLTILKQHIETSIRNCKQDIHKYSNALLAETEKCRSKARLVVDKTHEDLFKDIDETQNLMSQYTSEFNPLIDFFRRYRLSANPQDFMMMSPLIHKKIETMNEKSAEIQKHKGIFDAKVALKADFAGINEYLQNQYSSILITENLSDALPSDSTEMGRRIENDILAAMGRSSQQSSPGGLSDPDQKASSGYSSPESPDPDPQSDEFNYNRTGINFFHQFGSYGRGEYEFAEPSGVLYLLDGSLAVCDTANHRIMVYDSQFKYLRTIGQPPNLPPLRDRKEAESSRNDKYFSRTPSCLYFPYRIAQCPQTENIVVVERPPSRDIQIFTALGKFITCFGSEILQHPRGVAVDEHGVIVTVEGRTMKLMMFSQEGQLLHRFFLSVHLEFPNDVAARDGLIYISDNRGHCVHVFDYNAEHKHTIGNESVTYYPIGVSLTHLNQVVVTDNHNTFNISVFTGCLTDGKRQYEFGFKSKVRHANCYNVAVHPHRYELAVTSRENQVVVFNFDPHRQPDEDKERVDYVEISFR